MGIDPRKSKALPCSCSGCCLYSRLFPRTRVMTMCTVRSPISPQTTDLYAEKTSTCVSNWPEFHTASHSRWWELGFWLQPAAELSGGVTVSKPRGSGEEWAWDNSQCDEEYSAGTIGTAYYPCSGTEFNENVVWSRDHRGLALRSTKCKCSDFHWEVWK